MALLQIIYRYFLKSDFRCILYVFSNLGFRLTIHQETLIQCGRIRFYLYSIQIRLVGYHLFCQVCGKTSIYFFFVEMNHSLSFCNSSFTLRKAVFISQFQTSVNEKIVECVYNMLFRLSLKRGFGGCEHGFDGCDGFGGFSGFCRFVF